MKSVVKSVKAVGVRATVNWVRLWVKYETKRMRLSTYLDWCVWMSEVFGD